MSAWGILWRHEESPLASDETRRDLATSLVENFQYLENTVSQAYKKPFTTGKYSFYKPWKLGYEKNEH